MNKKIFGVSISLLLVALLTMSMAPVSATKPVPVSGQIMILGATNIVQNPAGNSANFITTLNLNGMFTGSITGLYTSESRWVTHNAGTADQWTHALGVDTISPATVMGKTGTLTFMINGKTGEGGTWVIIGGTGDLANLHGQGTYTPVSTYVMSYEGQLHFDPE